MATLLNYPTDLRGPLINRSKNQSLKSRVTGALSGPAYIQKLSTDAPANYDFNFIFNSPNEAILFRAWVEANEVNRGAPFNIPLNTEGNFGNGGQTTQEVRFMPTDIDLLSNTSNSVGIFNYSGTFQCRKEITGLEDDYDLIEEGGLYLLKGREILDTAINLDSPEG